MPLYKHGAIKISVVQNMLGTKHRLYPCLKKHVCYFNQLGAKLLI